MTTHVTVRVAPGAKEDRLSAGKNGRLLVSVRAAAERGLANKAAAALVAKHFRVSSGRVRLVSGAHSPSKIFSVDSTS